MRTPCVDKNGLKKGAWSEEEDSKLRAYILRYGHWNWRLLPKYAGLDRCGKSCRLRWVNYLKPGVKLGNYSKEEEDLIAKLHGELGNKWSAIAAKLPGRSDNEVKNYWHTHLKKRRPKRIPSPNSSCKNSLEAASSAKKLIESASNVPILESSGSDSGNRGPVSWDSDDSASSADQEFQTSLLSELEPILEETFYSPIRYFPEYERASSSEYSVDGFYQESFWSKPFEVDTSYTQDAVFAPSEEDVFFSSEYLFT